MPDLTNASHFITKHYKTTIVVFLILLFPAIYGNNHTKIYYNIADSLPSTLDSNVANAELKKDFDMSNIHMVMLDRSMDAKQKSKMFDEIDSVKGVKWTISMDSLIGPAVPDSMIPNDIKEMLQSDDYELAFVCSEYESATEEVNTQIASIDKIVKSYDKNAMVIGEAPCTKDLITITDKDFKTVSAVSIVAIFFIIFFVLKSISLPVILVAAIEFAIFVNMGIPYFTHTQIPFIASVVIGTIQLGATVDYAILMTTRYKTERNAGKDKHEAVTIALTTSMKSIMVSALGFFASTFGVGVYSSVDMISQLCTLMSRGAIISMITVICILPSMLMLFDKVIINTTMGMKKKENKLYKLPEIN